MRKVRADGAEALASAWEQVAEALRAMLAEGVDIEYTAPQALEQCARDLRRYLGGRR